MGQKLKFLINTYIYTDNNPPFASNFSISERSERFIRTAVKWVSTGSPDQGKGKFYKMCNPMASHFTRQK